MAFCLLVLCWEGPEDPCRHSVSSHTLTSPTTQITGSQQSWHPFPRGKRGSATFQAQSSPSHTATQESRHWKSEPYGCLLSYFHEFQHERKDWIQSRLREERLENNAPKVPRKWRSGAPRFANLHFMGCW